MLAGDGDGVFFEKATTNFVCNSISVHKFSFFLFIYLQTEIFNLKRHEIPLYKYKMWASR